MCDTVLRAFVKGHLLHHFVPRAKSVNLSAR
jgi:hypothetical protein